jgi:dipeptidyl-peptidase-4
LFFKRMTHHLSPLRLGAIAALIILIPGAVWAQKKLLTIDDLYDPAKKVNFGNTRPTREDPYVWLNDAEYVRRAKDGLYIRVQASSGTEAPLFDAAKLEAALSTLLGSAAANTTGKPRPLIFAPGYGAAAFVHGHDLYYWPLESDTVHRLTSSSGVEEQVAFSPDGRLLGFVRDNNLFVVDLDGHERALTSDGSDELLNGKLDWIYQEEIYGRGSYRAFWWSADSSRLAFLQLDEHQVPTFTIVDHIPIDQDVENTKYPQPGDPNPRVKLGVASASGGSVQWIDTTKYADADRLIVNVAWAPGDRQVAYQLQNREQTWLDLNLGNVTTGASTTLFRESTKAWVNDNGSPIWLKDGSFLWLSERSGFKHLYRYGGDGTLIGQITSGRWEVRKVYGVDEASGWIYFTGTERSAIGADVYRVKIDGTALIRVSQAEGTHSGAFNPSRSLYVDTWSAASTPPQARLHKGDGTEIRVIDSGNVPALAEYRLSTPEFVHVTTKDGFVLEAMLLKPPDFDPSRKYPVFQHTYGGPGAQQVRNAWSGTTGLYHLLLAQRGIVVWICDNRSASGKGAESAWVAYKRLGETELADMEECLGWLKAQPWVDGSRIGLNGWSYGGFMTSYALTHSASWSMGIAGGTVADWRDYDSIYTERFMLTPQNNPEGYERAAPRNAAKNLHGQLFLIHGTMDDNVHMANTLQFAYELQKAGKPFELMLYPKSRHGVTDPLLVKHMQERMLEFTLRTLTPQNGAAGTR